MERQLGAKTKCSVEGKEAVTCVLEVGGEGAPELVPGAVTVKCGTRRSNRLAVEASERGPRCRLRRCGGHRSLLSGAACVGKCSCGSFKVAVDVEVAREVVEVDGVLLLG